MVGSPSEWRNNGPSERRNNVWKHEPNDIDCLVPGLLITTVITLFDMDMFSWVVSAQWQANTTDGYNKWCSHTYILVLYSYTYITECTKNV